MQEIDIWTIKNTLKQINVTIFFKSDALSSTFMNTLCHNTSLLLFLMKNRESSDVSRVFFFKLGWPGLRRRLKKKGLINDFVVRNNLPWKSTPLGNSKGGQRHSSTSVRVGSKMHQKCHTMTTLFKKYLSILNCKLYYI